ncbi:MAG: helix-turn-helix transcriptional regulator [Clostridia bacterium]|nr:helix-turn-helix transcriptional regulator [Clostridia bacterium]
MEQEFFFGCEEKGGTGTLLPPCATENTLEMVLVSRGTVAVTSAMASFEAGEGELFFLPPQLVRTVEARNGFAAVRSIRFSCDLFEGMGEKIDNDLFYMFLIQSRNRRYRILPESNLYMPVRTYFEDCYGEYLSRELCYGLRIRGQLTLMMALILSSYGTTRENDRIVYHNVLRLRPALDYIDTHFEEKITVPLLADLLSVTPDYFTKLFRDSIGRTTVDYINAVRINRAMYDLLSTSLPVSEIAVRVGLGNGNYFSKVFRKSLGIQPLAFRRAAKKTV